MMNKDSQNLPPIKSLKRINSKNETVENLLTDLNKISQSDFILDQKTMRPFSAVDYKCKSSRRKHKVRLKNHIPRYTRPVSEYRMKGLSQQEFNAKHKR